MIESYPDNIEAITHNDIEIRIIRDKCISAGTCIVYSPSTFDLDDEGIAIIKKGDWDKFEKIVAAAESCPTFAIEVYKNGKKVYPEF
jgi:ferredoxin